MSDSGKYVVTVSNGFGCTAVSDTVTVDRIPTPVPTISKSAGVLYSDQVWATYQWVRDGIAISGGTWDSLVPTLPGAYSLIVRDTNGCDGESDTLYCTPVALEDVLTDAYGLTLYPNPTSGIVNVRTLKPIDWNVTVRITNMFGQKLREYQMAHLVSDAVFDLRDMANGMYLMEIETEKGERSVIRFMIE